MHYSNQDKRPGYYPNAPRIRPTENKPQNFHIPKDYQNQQNALVPKATDSEELSDLKSKFKLVMTKLSTVKKEKEQLQKQNKILQDEVTSLQSNLRHMVSGFSNTSSNFPTYNQIGSKFAEFYKYECLDLFFDILSPEMNMKGVTFFYYQSFERIDNLIRRYFAPCFQSITQTGCFETVEGPILNVLRKAFQTTYQEVIQKIKNEGNVEEIVRFIQKQMKLEDLNEEVTEQIKQFLYKIIELRLCCFISDPPFEINIKQIGQKVLFNPLIHEPFDGFIKPKDECWIVLPSVRKTNQQKEMVMKSLVLQVNYDQIN